MESTWSEKFRALKSACDALYAENGRQYIRRQDAAERASEILGRRFLPKTMYNFIGSLSSVARENMHMRT